MPAFGTTVTGCGADRARFVGREPAPELGGHLRVLRGVQVLLGVGKRIGGLRRRRLGRRERRSGIVVRRRRGGGRLDGGAHGACGLFVCGERCRHGVGLCIELRDQIGERLQVTDLLRGGLPLGLGLDPCGRRRLERVFGPGDRSVRGIGGLERSIERDGIRNEIGRASEARRGCRGLRGLLAGLGHPMIELRDLRERGASKRSRLATASTATAVASSSAARASVNRTPSTSSAATVASPRATCSRAAVSAASNRS